MVDFGSVGSLKMSRVYKNCKSYQNNEIILHRCQNLSTCNFLILHYITLKPKQDDELDIQLAPDTKIELVSGGFLYPQTQPLQCARRRKRYLPKSTSTLLLAINEKGHSGLCKKCMPCNLVKPHKRIRPPEDPRPVPDTRFSHLQIDIVGPLPLSQGYRYLLSVIDLTSRWVEALPMTEASTTACASTFIHGWVQRFGLPANITSDNGTVFVSNLWKEIQKELGIKGDLTPPYHPSSLGAIERRHRDIKSGLKTTLVQMGNESGDAWMNRLPWVMLWRRSAIQTDLGASPAELALGTHPKLPGDLIGAPTEPNSDQQLQTILQGLRVHNAQPATQMSSHGQKTPYYPDTSQVTHVFVQKGKPAPLGQQFEGPFRIIERLGKSCLKIQVGLTAAGIPRYETQYWTNCKPAPIVFTGPEAQKAAPGRKRLSPAAPTFTTTTPDTPNTQQQGLPPAKPATNASRPQRQRREPIRFAP